jgi:outer membrane protein with beta-barrel domain
VSRDFVALLATGRLIPTASPPFSSRTSSHPERTGWTGAAKAGTRGIVVRDFALSYRRSETLVAALAACAVTALASPAAFATDEEWHAGARAGIAVLSKTGVEPAFGAHGAYGINDWFDATVEVLGSTHVSGSGTDVFSASGGIAYKIDVFQWVPYVALLAGWYGYWGTPGPHGEHGSEFGASIQAGVDYLVLRELAVGADVRWHASFHDGFSVPLFTTTLSAEYRWGF